MNKISWTLGLLFSAGFASGEVLPVLTTVIPDVKLLDGQQQVIDLSSHFGVETVDSQVVRLMSNQPDGEGGFQYIDFALFTNATPLSRVNFLNYVNDGDYTNSVIHRSLPNFVIQGGGFTVSESGGELAFENVLTEPPVANEYGISNTYGTVSMAKLGGDPDSATSQWFVSIGANSDNLDNQNGGFTVFGRVTKSTLASATVWGSEVNYPAMHGEMASVHPAFSNMPLAAGYTSGSIVEEDVIKFTSASLVPLDSEDAGSVPDLIYTIVGDTNSEAADFSIVNNTLTVTGQVGGSEIVIRATDSVGNTVEDTFLVESAVTFDYWKSLVFTSEELLDPLVSGPSQHYKGGKYSNFQLYAQGFTPATAPDLDVLAYPIQATSGKPIFGFYLSSLNPVGYALQQSSDLGISDTWLDVETNVLQVNPGLERNIYYIEPEELTQDQDFYRMRFFNLPQ